MSHYILYISTDEYLMEKYWMRTPEERRFIVDNMHAIDPSEDSGFDLIAPNKVIINAGDTQLIDMKVKCKMVKRERDVYNEWVEKPAGFYMYPRSSIYKTPLRLANSVGIIDSGYRGTIRAPLMNVPNTAEYVAAQFGSSDLRSFDYTIEKTQRLVQLCAPNLSPFKVVFVESLDETERGEGGFGSTGR